MQWRLVVIAPAMPTLMPLMYINANTKQEGKAPSSAVNSSNCSTMGHKTNGGMDRMQLMLWHCIPIEFLPLQVTVEQCVQENIFAFLQQ